MGIENEFKEICKNLEKKKCCKCDNANPVLCARQELKRMIGNDKYRYLKIKTDGLKYMDSVKKISKESSRWYEKILMGISTIGGIVATFLANRLSNENVLGILAFFISVFFLYFIGEPTEQFLQSIGNRVSQKWEKYVMVALEDYGKEKNWV